MTLSEERIKEIEELESWLQYQEEVEEAEKIEDNDEELEIYNAHKKAIKKLKSLLHNLKFDIKLYNRYYLEEQENEQKYYYLGKASEAESLVDLIKYD